MKNKNYSLLVLLLFINSVFSYAQSSGSYKGKILDQATKQPIIGASILLDNTQLGAATDTEGVFSFKNIPIGIYSVTISYIGYQTKNISEVIISSGKTYYSEIEMLEEAINMSEVTVKARRGELNPLTPVSAFSFSREEIFRNPGV